MSEPEPYEDIAGIAAYLKVPKSFIYLAVKDKGLPVHRVGRYFRFRRSEVDAWMRASDASVNGGVNPARPKRAMAGQAVGG